MARVFAPEDQEDDFLQHLLKSRVQRNPQLQRQKIQLVGGAPEEPAPPAPKPQPLTGLIRSEKAMPRPSSGPPVPSLTPEASTGSGTGSGDARAAAINRVARQIGADPLDLATVISYESAGKFSPSIYGGKGGRHLGLIQFGPAEQKHYGVHAGQSFDEQMNAVGRYLVDRGYKPGMDRAQLYSTINAGRPGLLNARDAAAGGAPGTVLDKVRTQMAGHEAKARALLGNPASAALSSTPAAAPLAVTAPGPRADALPSSRDGRVQVASNDPSFVPLPPTRPTDAELQALPAFGAGPGAKVLPQEAGGPAPGAPMPEPRVTEMPPAASAAPEVNVTTPMSEADLAGAGGGDTGLGGLLGGLAKGLGGGSSGGNLNAERTMSPGMGQGYDEKLGAASKAALNAQPLFGNIGDLAKTRQLSKMFDLQDLGQIGQPQLARRKLGFGL